MESNWYERFGNEKSLKMKVCGQVLTSSTQLQNKLFHFVQSAKKAAKCIKVNIVLAKRGKLLFVTFLSPSSSWLFKLPINAWCDQVMYDASC